MEIVLYRNESCPDWEKALFELRVALALKNIKVEPKIVTITTLLEAKKVNFYGSPTVKIDGKDIELFIDEAHREPSLETCRVYFYKGKYLAYPPKQLIIDFLEITGKGAKWQGK